MSSAERSTPHRRTTETPPDSPRVNKFDRNILDKESEQIKDLANLLSKVFTAIEERWGSNPAPPDSTPAQTALLEGVFEQRQKYRYKIVEELWNAAECKYNVVDCPADDSSKKEPEHTFVVRVRTDKFTESPNYFIDVKSNVLRDALRTAIGAVSGVSFKEEKPTINRNIFFFYLPNIEAVLHSAGLEQPSHDCLNLLAQYIRDAYHPTTRKLEPLVADGEITYDLLWTLFKPDSVLYTHCLGTGAPRCIKVNFGEARRTKKGEDYFYVEGCCYDYDGQVFGESVVSVVLESFRGAKKIHCLEAFPLQYHPHRQAVMERLVQQGKSFVDLIGVQHCEFNGSAFYVDKGEPRNVRVQGRVTIGAASFHQMNPNYVRPTVDKALKEESNESHFGMFFTTSSEQDVLQSKGLTPTKLTDQELILCCPTVLGFSYKKKLWLEFEVRGISHMEWNRSALDDLVLPQGQKDVIIALVEAQMGVTSTTELVDVVEGKGQGLNILLHGPPGVGKTLTAEVVSEHLQRPLYSISAGELGLDAKSLDNRLETVFQLAQQWDLILLLDEADVFLEQRGTDNLTRHQLVSVFLRRLEYFRGILILTTNRVENFDIAVLSRIQWKMQYSEIDPESRIQLWNKNLKRAYTHCGDVLNVTKQELNELARKPFNGREIKNTVFTACALARKSHTPFSYAHLQKVIDATEVFQRAFFNTERSEHLYN